MIPARDLACAIELKVLVILCDLFDLLLANTTPTLPLPLAPPGVVWGPLVLVQLWGLMNIDQLSKSFGRSWHLMGKFSSAFCVCVACGVFQGYASCPVCFSLSPLKAFRSQDLL